MTNNEKNKISVIVTFYNLEEYVSNCMDSLTNQDYKNCEFICVDDGSTDNTLEKLNTYSSDNRVRVLHKKNGGLSDARNFGLENATGEYITFIDGDDYVHPNYISNLVNAKKNNTNCVVISKIRLVKYSKNLDVNAGWDRLAEFQHLTKREVFEKILYNELSVSACGKLFPAHAYDNIQFPVGKVSEEVEVIGELLCKFNDFIIINQPQYGYVMRDDSIGHKRKVPIKDITDRIDSFSILEDKVEKEYNIQNDMSMRKALQYGKALRYVNMALLYERVYDDRNAVKQIKTNTNKWLRENIVYIMANTRAPFMQRVRFLIYTLSSKTYVKMYTLFQKIRYSI